MTSDKNLLTAVPKFGSISIQDPAGTVIGIHVGEMEEGVVADWVISLLSEFYDTSSLSRETLHQHVQIILWEGNKITTRWNN